VDRALIQKAVEEARNEGANLVIWDKRDTFTVEQDDVADLEISDDHLRVKMQDGKVTVYVELDSIYKLVVERERSRRSGARTGFGAVGS
jgi:DNA-binding LytR/AlgR family response regulator